LTFAQPNLSIPEVNTACAAGPGADTVVSTPDRNGYFDLFDIASV
jgi:hypothetical protein